MNKKVYIVMYHYVRDLRNSRYPEIKGLDYSLFKEQILWFKQHFTFIRMEELIAAFDEGYDLPDNAVLLTFDDGYIDHYTYVYPVLKAAGIQGAFFIPGKAFAESRLLDVNKVHFILASTPSNILKEELFKQLDFYRVKNNFLSNEELYDKYAIANRFDTKDTIFIKRILQTGIPENYRSVISSNLFKKYIGIDEAKFAKELYMNYDQIKCMKRGGMFIGVHGYDHYWMGNLSAREMQNDINKALECLDSVISAQSWVMNFPYGSYNESVINYISTIGCSVALTTEVNSIDIIKNNRYRLPRLDTNDFPPRSNNYLRF